MKNIKINWDVLGIGTSLVCAVHCAVLPLLLASLPLFGVNIIHNQWFEYFMILLTVFIGSYSLVHGYRKHHRRFLPILLFAIGGLFLFAKQYWHDYELFILPFALIAIVTAHFINYRFSHPTKKGKTNTINAYA